MIEDTVDDHANVPGVRLCNEPGKQLVPRFQVLMIRHTADVEARVCVVMVPGRKKISRLSDNLPQMRVHIIIILRIILVIGRRHKDRIQIDCLHAELLQIIQLVDDSLKISSVEISHVHICRGLIPVLDSLYMLVDIAVFIGENVIRGIAVPEPVRINLVHDASLRPVRRMESRNDPEQIIRRRLSLHTELTVKTGIVSCHDLKIIRKNLVPDFDLNAEKIKPVAALLKVHPHSGVAMVKIYRMAYDG